MLSWKHRRCERFDLVPSPECGYVIHWPCGLSLWIYKRSPWYLHTDEARFLHDRRRRQPCS